MTFVLSRGKDWSPCQVAPRLRTRPAIFRPETENALCTPLGSCTLALHLTMNCYMSTEQDPGRCPLCNRGNACGLADPTASASTCWCFSAQIASGTLELIPAEVRGRACLCSACLRQLQDKQDH